MYNGKVLENQSLNSLNIRKGVSFDLIIAKEKIALLSRTYVTIEDVKYVVADLKKRSCVVYTSENKVSSYHGLIVIVYDYGEEIIFRVLKINSGIEFVKIDLISLKTRLRMFLIDFFVKVNIMGVTMNRMIQFIMRKAMVLIIMKW